MDPPAQDSPKNILNVLDNDCLEEIFRRIYYLKDFLNMAEVCQRFQASAKNCFRMQFPQVLLDENFGTKLYKEKQRDRLKVPSHRAIALLNIFGPFMQELCFESSSNQEHDDKIFELISKCTSKTLKKFHIFGNSVDFTQIHFPALELLCLSETVPKNLEHIPVLKDLRMYKTDLRCFIRTYPQLERFDLHYGIAATDDLIAEFLSLNPQLQRLYLYDENRDLTPLSLRAIGTYSINLVSLGLFLESHTTNLLNINLPHLGTLRHLKRFEITLNNTTPFKIMMNVFAENEVPIEEINVKLWMPGMILHFLGHTVEVDPCCDMLTIKTLKVLNINGYYDKRCFDEMFVNVVKTQTALESLKTYCMGDPLPMLGIRNILKYGRKLSKFVCYVASLQVDLDMFKSVLCLVRNRVRVKIIVGHKEGNCIPEDVLAANNEWLEVRYIENTEREGIHIWIRPH